MEKDYNLSIDDSQEIYIYHCDECGNTPEPCEHWAQRIQEN